MTKPLIIVSVLLLVGIVTWFALVLLGVNPKSLIQNTGITKLGANHFNGTITSTSDHCKFDGGCSITVDGKHISTGGGLGWCMSDMGTVSGQGETGVPTADLIGKKAEVYAEPNGQNTFTLCGSKDYYIKISP